MSKAFTIAGARGCTLVRRVREMLMLSVGALLALTAVSTPPNTT
jgi:hypothetical protein